MNYPIFWSHPSLKAFKNKQTNKKTSWSPFPSHPKICFTYSFSIFNYWLCTSPLDLTFFLFFSPYIKHAFHFKIWVLITSCFSCLHFILYFINFIPFHSTHSSASWDRTLHSSRDLHNLTFKRWTMCWVFPTFWTQNRKSTTLSLVHLAIPRASIKSVTLLRDLWWLKKWRTSWIMLLLYFLPNSKMQWYPQGNC